MHFSCYCLSMTTIHHYSIAMPKCLNGSRLPSRKLFCLSYFNFSELSLLLHPWTFKKNNVTQYNNATL